VYYYESTITSACYSGGGGGGGLLRRNPNAAVHSAKRFIHSYVCELAKTIFYASHSPRTTIYYVFILKEQCFYYNYVSAVVECPKLSLNGILL